MSLNRARSLLEAAGMGMSLSQSGPGPDPKQRYGNYKCPHCGERHASGTTEILCPGKADFFTFDADSHMDEAREALERLHIRKRRWGWFAVENPNPDPKDLDTVLRYARWGQSSATTPGKRADYEGLIKELTKYIEPTQSRPKPAGTIANPEAESEDESDDEAKTCPTCGGPLGVMGTLGNRTHYQCRNCGMQYSDRETAEETEKMAEQQARESVEIRDDGGATFARYTIRIGEGLYQMSENPADRHGYNAFLGRASDVPQWSMGKSLRTLEQVPQQVQEAIQQHLGLLQGPPEIAWLDLMIPRSGMRVFAHLTPATAELLRERLGAPTGSFREQPVRGCYREFADPNLGLARIQDTLSADSVYIEVGNRRVAEALSALLKETIPADSGGGAGDPETKPEDHYAIEVFDLQNGQKQVQHIRGDREHNARFEQMKQKYPGPRYRVTLIDQGERETKVLRQSDVNNGQPIGEGLRKGTALEFDRAKSLAKGAAQHAHPDKEGDHQDLEIRHGGKAVAVKSEWNGETYYLVDPAFIAAGKEPEKAPDAEEKQPAAEEPPKEAKKESFADEESIATELQMFIENDVELYQQQYLPILKNLTGKQARGIYDSGKAVTGFLYLVDAGAQKYAEQFGGPGDVWHKMFPRSVRLMVAKNLVEEFEQEYDLGNYDEYIPKKYGGQRYPAQSDAGSDMGAV